MPGATRGLHQMSCSVCLYFVLEDRYLTKPGPHRLPGWPVNLKDPSASTGPLAGITGMHGHARLFTWMLGIGTPELFTSPALRSYFYNNIIMTILDRTFFYWKERKVLH